MADTTLTAPYSDAQLITAGLAPNVAIAAEEMLSRFAEMADITPYATVIEVGGMGSKAVRRGNRQHLASVLPTALSTETQQAGLISRTVGYDSVTVAPYGFGESQTYDSMIFGVANVSAGLSMQAALAEMPMSYLRLARYLACQTLSGITATAGATGTALSLDDVIAAQTVFNGLFPVESVSSAPLAIFHSEQVEDLRASIRIEPGFVQSGAAMGAQAIDNGQILANFMGLGFDVLKTNDVAASGGGHRGALIDRGGILLGVGQTQRVPAPADGRAFLASNAMGLLIQEVIEARSNRSTRLDGYFYLGASLGDANVFRQVQVISIDN